MVARAAQGMHSYGADVFYNEYLEDCVAGAFANSFGEVISIGGPSDEFPEVKVTHLKSPDKFHEKVPAFGDGGEVNFNMNFTSAEYAAARALLPSASDTAPSYGRKCFKIMFPDASGFRFKGHIKSMPVDVPEDDRITVAVTIVVSGKPTFFTP